MTITRFLFLVVVAAAVLAFYDGFVWLTEELDKQDAQRVVDVAALYNSTDCFGRRRIFAREEAPPPKKIRGCR